MSENQNLVTIPGQPLVEAQTGELTLTADQILESIGPYLPRCQLFSSNSNAVKEHTVPAGIWGIPISGTMILQLGLEVDVILVASRDRAMQWDGEEMHSSTDKTCEKFKNLKKLSDADSDSGAMYGTEFLVWLGKQGLYATLFLGSKSARRETLAFMQQLNTASQLFNKLIGSKRKWEIPQIRATKAFPYDLPSEGQTTAAWKKFNEADKDEGEAVDADDAAKDGSRVR